MGKEKRRKVLFFRYGLYRTVTWLDIVCNEDPPLYGCQAKLQNVGSWPSPPRLAETTQILYMLCYIISRTSKKLKGDLALKIHNWEFLHHLISYWSYAYVAFVCVLAV